MHVIFTWPLGLTLIIMLLMILFIWSLHGVRAKMEQFKPPEPLGLDGNLWENWRRWMQYFKLTLLQSKRYQWKGRHHFFKGNVCVGWRNRLQYERHAKKTAETELGACLEVYTCMIMITCTHIKRNLLIVTVTIEYMNTLHVQVHDSVLILYAVIVYSNIIQRCTQ